MPFLGSDNRGGIIKNGLEAPVPRIRADFAAQVAALKEAGTNVHEQMIGKIVDMLMDDKHLKKMSRLNHEEMYFMLKHLLAENFYQQYWLRVEYDITFQNADVPGGVIPNVTYGSTDERLQERITVSYDRFITDMFSLTLAKDGKGRTELLEALKVENTSALDAKRMELMGGGDLRR